MQTGTSISPSGEANGSFHFYENTGDAETPLLVERVAGANPFVLLSVSGGLSTPALSDVDLDGDLDLVAGDGAQGTFSYFENIGFPIDPIYVARSGAANPLDGLDVGLDASPAFADIDVDGDSDLVSGQQDGGFTTYYLPEPSPSALLAAGAGLLAWLARWRKRAG